MKMRSDEIKRIERVLKEYRILRYENPEAAAKINEAVNKLPTEQHKAIILIYFVGLSRAEAADALYCSQQTVRRWCLRAIGRLPRALGHLKRKPSDKLVELYERET